MTSRSPRLLLALLLSASVVVTSAAEPELAEFLWTRYWTVPPDLWMGGSSWTPPEKQELDRRHRNDVGVAFSGGGTRSAAAAVGQLRGLLHNGWLERVRYITAVSGGSWASVPFTYSPAEPEVLLGQMLDPKDLDKATVEAPPAKESLAYSITHSQLLAPGAAEAAKLWGQAELAKRDISPQVASFLNRFVRGSADETYANILGGIFIKPYVPGGTESRFTWDADSIGEIKELNPSFSVSEFVRVTGDRPFLIVTGTMIYTHPAYDYPRLIPVEYTPLYTGVRQQFGSRLGGIYVSPYAYDVAGADLPHDQRVRVKVKPADRPFTLADVIASSGAAPLLALFRGRPLQAAKQATVIFPSFNHFTIRGQDPSAEAEPIVEDLLHGDGGFSDNLGIMPLLARQVHNILVFVNAKEPFEKNEAVESMFWRLDKQEDTGGDRSMNAVFDPSHYWEVRRGLEDAVHGRGAAVYCGRQWNVKGNELYNIAPYENLNICWIYNELIPSWVTTLPKDTQAMVASKDFKNFPWFSTFGENIPYVIRLKPAQVNLLAHLAAWTVTNPTSRQAIEAALGDALSAPK